MNRKVCILAMVLALIPASAFAQDMHYTFVQSAWVNVDPDTTLMDSGSGPALDVSYGITDFIHLVGLYNDFEFDMVGSSSTFDMSTWGFGAGVHHTMRDGFDLVGELAYIDMDFDSGGLGASEDGYQLCAEVRYRIAERFELQGGLEHIDLGDFGDDTLFGVDGRFNINERFAVGAGYKVGDDDRASIGFRFNFGQR